jgi:phage tail sheath protein FI
MTVPTSYPGVYIQELPSLVHAVQPAPTSVAVFVGYTHPFLTKQWGVAVPLFSFADYQTNFGGFFTSPWQPDFVGQAVFQFFENGGPMCYVVGLQAQNYYTGQDAFYVGGTSKGAVKEATVALPPTGTAVITFTALQPVGVAATTPATGTLGVPMTVAISNLQQTAGTVGDTADIVISYGSAVETYRKVVLTSLPATLANSSLVSATVASGTKKYPSVSGSPFSFGYGTAPPTPAPGTSVINAPGFAAVFADYAPLDKVPVFNLLAIPGIAASSVTSEAVAYCERKRAFYIMDTPSPAVKNWDVNALVTTLATGGSLSPAPPVSINAAVYYPWLLTTDPITGAQISVPPSGFVAGAYGNEDSTFGVWKAPAGIETALTGTSGVDPAGVMSDPQQGILNSSAVDCLRNFPGLGTVVFGARTTAGANTNTAQQQWRYVPVRRTALFIEQSLYASLTWAVFQPNAAPLWTALTQEVGAFMLSLFRQGAFAGTTPSQAFLVQCDATTTTQTDVANGVVNILVGFAPLVPAEFVIIQIAQLAGQAQV